MIRLLVEDVTLLRAEKIILHIRFKGGATKTLTVALPLNAWQQRATNPEVVREIDRLLEHNTYSQIASELNGRALLSGEGNHSRRTSLLVSAESTVWHHAMIDYVRQAC